MIIMIDNYDSFTYNLVQYCGDLGEDVRVFRNNKITLAEITRLHPQKIVISPGPGRPVDAGISKDLIRAFKDRYPILGVCLGHQCIAEVFGAKIVRAKRIMHGKISSITHDNKKIFTNIENPFEATRYHSLIVERDNLPECFDITAQTERSEIMGIRHRQYPIEGIQFHPESILTKTGKELLQNFLTM